MTPLAKGWDEALNALLWAFGALGAVLALTLPLALAAAILAWAWRGPAARAGWRVHAWKVGRRLRRSRR